MLGSVDFYLKGKYGPKEIGHCGLFLLRSLLASGLMHHHQCHIVNATVSCTASISVTAFVPQHHCQYQQHNAVASFVAYLGISVLANFIIALLQVSWHHGITTGISVIASWNHCHIGVIASIRIKMLLTVLALQHQCCSNVVVMGSMALALLQALASLDCCQQWHYRVASYVADVGIAIPLLALSSWNHYQH